MDEESVHTSLLLGRNEIWYYHKKGNTSISAQCVENEYIYNYY
jgi:hypothetical protein